MSFSMHNASYDHELYRGKNVFTIGGTDRPKRRPSQFEEKATAATHLNGKSNCPVRVPLESSEVFREDCN
ncbi:hypothetical protein Q1695_003569 [Nippostrongylus brasiliensis]|nr:hypothetical protein Q1695_003569 [Nippostrongylus brasiliensis]